MKITLELRAGKYPYRDGTKADIQKNISAIERAIAGKPRSGDFVPLLGVVSILESIRDQLLP